MSTPTFFQSKEQYISFFDCRVRGLNNSLKSTRKNNSYDENISLSDAVKKHKEVLAEVEIIFNNVEKWTSGLEKLPQDVRLPLARELRDIKHNLLKKDNFYMGLLSEMEALEDSLKETMKRDPLTNDEKKQFTTKLCEMEKLFVLLKIDALSYRLHIVTKYHEKFISFTEKYEAALKNIENNDGINNTEDVDADEIKSFLSDFLKFIQEIMREISEFIKNIQLYFSQETENCSLQRNR